MGRRRIKFWIDQVDQYLYIQNVEDNKVKTVKDPKKIVSFLNVYRLSADELREPIEDYDLLDMFEERTILDVLPFLKRKKED